MQSSATSLATQWLELRNDSAKQVLSSLQQLVANSHRIGKIPVEHAETLLRLLQSPPAGIPPADVQVACLLLLARWAMEQHAVQGLKAGSDEPWSAAAQEAVAAAVLQAERLAGPHGRDAAPQLGAAAIYFLGCAAGACEAGRRESCCAAVCQALHDNGSVLLQSGLAPELIAGVGHLLSALQDNMHLSLWALASLLRAWGRPGAAAAAAGQQGASPQAAVPGIDSMVPLYPTMRRLGSSLAPEQPPGAAAGSRAEAYAQLLESPLQSELREEHSAAVLAAGGLLEGCLRAPRPLPAPHAGLAHLEDIVSSSCRQAAAAQAQRQGRYDASSPSGSTAEEKGGRGDMLWRDATSVALTELHQACRRPEPSAATLSCLLGTLLGSTLSLRGLFEAAAAGQPPATASAWVHRHLGGGLIRGSAACARAIADQYCAARPAAQQTAQLEVQAFAARFHEQYRVYALRTPAAWLDAVDGGAVLDKVFMCAVLLLSAFWDASSGGGGGSGGGASDEAAARAMDALASLQFCRMRLSAYSLLLQRVLTTLVRSPQACAELLRCLPAADGLTGPGPDGATPLWEADAVLASRVQFLMSMLGPCVPRLQQCQVLEAACPIALLYLLHPHPPVAASAHKLFCAVLRHVDEREELVPYYVRRALEGYPARTPLAGLAQGYEAIASALPPADSPVLLLGLARLAARAREVLALPPPADGGGDGAQPHPQPQQQQADLNLVKLFAHLLLIIDFQVLPDALEILEEAVLGLPPEVAVDACSCIEEVLASSNDYTRKTLFVRWYMRLAAACSG